MNIVYNNNSNNNKRVDKNKDKKPAFKKPSTKAKVNKTKEVTTPKRRLRSNPNVSKAEEVEIKLPEENKKPVEEVTQKEDTKTVEVLPQEEKEVVPDLNDKTDSEKETAKKSSKNKRAKSKEKSDIVQKNIVEKYTINPYILFFIVLVLSTTAGIFIAQNVIIKLFNIL